MQWSMWHKSERGRLHVAQRQLYMLYLYMADIYTLYLVPESVSARRAASLQIFTRGPARPYIGSNSGIGTSLATEAFSSVSCRSALQKLLSQCGLPSWTPGWVRTRTCYSPRNKYLPDTAQHTHTRPLRQRSNDLRRPTRNQRSWLPTAQVW